MITPMPPLRLIALFHVFDIFSLSFRQHALRFRCCAATMPLLSRRQRRQRRRLLFAIDDFFGRRFSPPPGLTSFRQSFLRWRAIRRLRPPSAAFSFRRHYA
jgi:hypothetical protein